MGPKKFPYKNMIVPFDLHMCKINYITKNN